MTDHPDEDCPQMVIDKALVRLTRFERSLTRVRWVLLGVVIVAVVSTTGWWLTARDQEATRRNGTVADCRAVELARTLDLFQVIVSPTASDDEKDRASHVLAAMPSLQARYRACGAGEA